MTGNVRAILIAGPTASGKSALAMALAERFGGTIVNVDSMQVYQDVRVLTSRPSVNDESRIPHRLYGHVGAEQAYSAGQYALDVAAALQPILAQQRLPILVGGTGLYFKVMLEGLSPVPAIDPEVRRRWRLAAEEADAGDLHRMLIERDPVMAAKLAPSDRQRVVRALEVIEQTGRSLAEWQQVAGEPVLDGSGIVGLVVAPPREVLHARAERRFAKMLDGGAIAEVDALVSRDLNPGQPILRALGVNPIRRLLAGEIDRETALELGQVETRQYIKRQTTWLRKNMMSWKWLSAQQTESQMAESLMFIDF